MEGAAAQVCGGAAVAQQARMQHGGGHRGGTRGDTLRIIDAHRHPGLGEVAGSECPGQPSAMHRHGMRWREPLLLLVAAIGAGQALTFERLLIHFMHFESHALQAAPDASCCGEGGDGSASGGQLSHALEQGVAPHVGVTVGCEAVEEPGVRRVALALGEVGQTVDHIAMVEL